MSAHRTTSKNSRSPDKVGQKRAAEMAIPRQRIVNNGRNSRAQNLDSIESAALAWANAQYNLGFRVGSRGRATEVVSRQQAVAAARFREAVAGARALLRAFAGGGA